MRPSRAATAALVALLSMPSTGRADGPSTMEMMGMCKPVVDATLTPDDRTKLPVTLDIGTCYGAFMALNNLSFVIPDNERFNKNESILGICPPSDASFNHGALQMVRIFDVYARKHPEIQHQRFELTALAALREAFPCKPQQ